jgi:vacuolar protein sorting-associated protein 45
MIHELVGRGITNNTVSLKGVAGVAADMQEIVIASSQDEFFRNNMYANYGDIAEAVKGALDDYSASQAVHSNISSIGMLIAPQWLACA